MSKPAARGRGRECRSFSPHRRHPERSCPSCGARDLPRHRAVAWEIPRPAGKDAGLRDDSGYVRDFQTESLPPAEAACQFERRRHHPELQITRRAATIKQMPSLYQRDLAYVHAAAFETLARGAAGEIVRRLQSSGAAVRRVLDVGCGAGPLTEALVAAGFDVTGVDASADLLELARALVPTAHFVHASVYDVPTRGFDAVVALGEPLTYHAEGSDADRLVSQFFQRVAQALPPGGMLIFDVIGLGEPSLAGRNWVSGDNWAVLVETTEDQAQRTLVRNIEVFRRVSEAYRRSREVHRIRLFDIPTLCHQLASCGFATETAQAYGAQKLPPRRHAFFATRLAAKGSAAPL